MSLRHKRVLIIGGGSGIGKAVAESALNEGADVVVASRTAGPKQLDVTDEQAVASFFSEFAPFDHIAFTAGDWGGPPPGPVAELNISESREGLDVRFWGVIAVAKYGASRLPPGGSFTITSGMIAHAPVKGRALSTAVLGAVESLALGLAVDLAPVRVNCVCPGITHTAVWDRVPAEQLLKMTQNLLVPRPGRPAEAAEAYLYCMRNAYATGQILRVEGGSSLAR